MNFQPHRFLVLLSGLALMVALNSCQPSASQAKGNPVSELSDKDTLMASLRELQRMTIIYPASSDSANQYLAWGEKMAQNSRFLQIDVQSDLAFPDSLLHSSVLFLLGKMEDNRLIRFWEDQLPVTPNSSGFRFQDKNYLASNHSILLSWYPNPLAPTLPLAILTGNSEEAIFAIMNHSSGRGRMGMPWSSWDYQVMQGDQKLLIGNYGNDWRADPQVRWEFDLNQDAAWAGTLVNIRTHEFDDLGLCAAIGDSLEQRRQRWEAWTGKKLPSVSIDYHLYGHPETMGISLGEMETGLRQGNSIHRIVHPAFVQIDPGLEWELWMEQTYGPPSLQIIQDGIRVFLTPDFQKLGFHALAASLIRAEGNVPLQTMLSADAYTRESSLVRDCYAGAFAEFLLEYLGKDSLLACYQHMAESSPEMAGAWDSYQNQLMDKHPEKGTNKVTVSYHKGMTFAHEGYQVYNGYGSRLAENELQKLHDLGANAIAIVPYTGTSNPKSMEPFRWSGSAGSENDASVILSYYKTHATGMNTMLKPQVWVQGGWPGDVDMPKEEDWEVWFDQYHRWIRHYALLSEIHNMEILCLGTEFRYATLKHPERWRNLVSRIRHIYHGTITYAANWGEEVENLGFADALDFVGVNCYYPLSEKEAPTDEELAARMEKTLTMLDQLSKKWNRPYVMTEIGFRSIVAPWQHPHAEAGEAAVSNTDQARCYKVVLDALPRHPACRGLYWWKWPSHETYAHRNPRTFTPCGKEAEQILRDAYQSW